MQEDKLNGIVTFLAVVEAGNFSTAAARAELTRSAVAKSVAKLEARLGVRLFHRTTRTLTLTDEGARYYEHCSDLMASLKEVEAALLGDKQEPQGRVRISAPVVFGRRCVAPVVRSIIREHPGMKVESEFSDRLVDVIAEGFDLTVRIGPLADSASLVARKIGSQQMAIFAAPAYAARHGIPSSISELKGHRAILYGKASQDRSWPVRNEQGQTVRILLDGREGYDDLQAVADSAIAGGGLAWLPRWLGMPYVVTQELVMVMDSDQVAPMDVHVLWGQTRFLPYRTRILIETLCRDVPAILG